MKSIDDMVPQGCIYRAVPDTFVLYCSVQDKCPYALEKGSMKTDGITYRLCNVEDES